LRQKAAAAQVALEMAKAEIIDDPGNGTRYLQTGIARARHNCTQLKETCSAIEELMLVYNRPRKPRSRPSNSPPWTPRPNSSTNSLTDEESDEDCIIVAEFGPKFAQGHKALVQISTNQTNQPEPK